MENRQNCLGKTCVTERGRWRMKSRLEQQDARSNDAGLLTF